MSGQSPIDLDARYPSQTTGNLKLNITNIVRERKIVNDALQIDCEGTLIFRTRGMEGFDKEAETSELQFQQFHFHSPSEHTLNGNRYPLEMHLVSTWKDEIVVIAFLFSEGVKNRFIQALLDGDLVEIDHELEKKVNTQHKYLYYIGSLTTPRYTEGVHWLVSARQPQLSREQIESFRRVFGWGNFRELQDKGNREVRQLIV